MAMSQPADQRLTRYTAKLIPARTAAILTLRLPGMQFGAGRWLAEQARLRAACAGVLGGEAVVARDYGKYMAFLTASWALRRRGVTGTALRDEAALLVALWKERGLTESLCNTLQKEVAGIGKPAAP